MVSVVLFFFFKQKTAYEIEYGLVGSEMCIRDRVRGYDVERATPVRRHAAARFPDLLAEPIDLPTRVTIHPPGAADHLSLIHI